jgi:hypothetical protein
MNFIVLANLCSKPRLIQTHSKIPNNGKCEKNKNPSNILTSLSSSGTSLIRPSNLLLPVLHPNNSRFPSFTPSKPVVFTKNRCKNPRLPRLLLVLETFNRSEFLLRAFQQHLLQNPRLEALPPSSSKPGAVQPSKQFISFDRVSPGAFEQFIK